MAHGLTENALREWMERLGPRLINISAGICRDRHRAEEIVQEAFIKLWRQPPDAGEVAYSSWLRRVVTNLSINALKRTKRPGALPEHSSDRSLQTQHRPYERIDERDQMDRLHAAMERLDEQKRAILVLRAYEQLSYEEIATHLDVPIGTVMSRLNRARAALQKELESEAQETGAERPVVFSFRQQA